MIRLITTRRLVALEGEIAHLRRDLQALRLAAQSVLTDRRLAEQARDFYQEQAAKWEKRASRFIDAAHLKAGTLESPAMAEEAAAPLESSSRGIMKALNVREIRKPTLETAGGGILGVNERAAREAVSSVLNPS